MEALDAILDAGGADESHPLAGLVGELVENYETKRHPTPGALNATEALAFLMAQHGMWMRQPDLPDIGNQAKVSEVLSGKREINLRQALAKRFGVEIEVRRLKKR